MFHLLPIIIASAVLTNLAQTTQHIKEGKIGARVEITAVVSTIGQDSGTTINVGLKDTSGEHSGNLRHANDRTPKFLTGDTVKVTGQIRPGDPYRYPLLCFDSLTVLSHGPSPKPTEITARELLDGSSVGKFVSLKGIVLDSFRDEIDTCVFFLAIDSDASIIYASLAVKSDLSLRLKRLIGAEIRLQGICSTGGHFSYRPLSGHMISLASAEDITVLRSSKGLFDAPELKSTKNLSPAEVIGFRYRRTTGIVRATWQARHVLLETQNGHMTINLSEGQPLPDNGQTIEVVGLTETDLYHINLSHVFWRAMTNRTTEVVQHFKSTRIKDIFTDKDGRDKIDPRLHGRAISVTGIVKDISRNKRITLEDAGFTLPVDCSVTPGAMKSLSVGCIIRASGICVMDTDTWTPYSTFPHIRGFSLVLQAPDDLTIISTPSWWTSDRLLIILAILIGVLIGIIIWNRALNKLVDKRSYQLAKEKMAHDRADVRAEERTRLSVELHDTIAQNLSGIALQLDAIQLAAEDEPEILFDTIKTAQQCLSSCRQNLRLCLWDLRSRAFEEKSMNAALVRTLKPHQGDTTINIDCPIGTRGMSDNAIHAILCIVREAVLNAIRHGNATQIFIVGREKGGLMEFQIQDNGSGFDPGAIPGIADGHFGLQGIRERVHQLKGTFEIFSRPGTGTTVTLRQLSGDI